MRTIQATNKFFIIIIFGHSISAMDHSSQALDFHKKYELMYLHQNAIQGNSKNIGNSLDKHPELIDMPSSLLNDASQSTALFKAVTYTPNNDHEKRDAYLKTIQILLARGANPNLQSIVQINEQSSQNQFKTKIYYDKTPLMVALEKLDSQVVDMLLAAGSKLTITDYENCSPLYILHRKIIACATYDLMTIPADYLKLFKKLLNTGANPNYDRTPVNKETLLQYTLRMHALLLKNRHLTVRDYPFISIAKLLLDAGANPLICNNEGNNALHTIQQLPIRVKDQIMPLLLDAIWADSVFQ